ncbi:hypothetical protein NLU13_5862 [Sarocladium strictum]|uniref:FHA domain-containing protein n=1 Tax=Sarocladium strictum TaxID=5046 RepID=A0AA39GEV2_SARSR|nr:hypothetical protein NLU13_5862 [Sarocladium strictum]
MDASSRATDAHGEPSLPPPKPQIQASTIAGVKRPAPSLLPPLELSSSPGLPRPLKRHNTGSAQFKYPTPVPTSTTGILSSSPVRRPALTRTTSERAPLSAVPSVELSENGEVLTMGRSSNSSHFQLSANRLISRVHIRARYIPAPNPGISNKIEIVCEGWNGLTLHCQGRTEELLKGDSFTSSAEGTDIMIDVQDARVMVQWPKRASDAIGTLSDSSWDDSPQSQRRENALLQSSPLRRTTRIASPESPTPRNLTSSQRLQALLPLEPDEDDDANLGSGIQIFEDEPSVLPPLEQRQLTNVNASMRTEATASFKSELSDPEEEDKDPNEENDPIVHSFGPFGADISGRIASMLTKSPAARPNPAKRLRPISSNDTIMPRAEPSAPTSPQTKSSPRSDSPLSSPPPLAEEPMPTIEINPAVSNHVVNQLAFSRLSSTPLSTIMANLPLEEKRDLTMNLLRSTIEATPCIGTIARQGKDAAGKPLESEYYYMPEKDDDEQRRAAVVDGLRKPSLRNCRKQHKQYYWKRPKTP